jgi:signal-transduction protein with cAMP-binding, CBS, and nucleotidyltransferase domain
MKVKDVMTHTAFCCGAEMNLGKAVELMWIHNCGMLPVVASNGKLTAVLTDRDVCIALGTRNHLAGDLKVEDVATSPAFTCEAEDEIHEALGTMASKQVRRLPVVDKNGMPQGVLSIDDIVSHSDKNKTQGCCELASEEIVRTLKRIYGQQLPLVRVRAA